MSLSELVKQYVTIVQNQAYQLPELNVDFQFFQSGKNTIKITHTTAPDACCHDAIRTVVRVKSSTAKDTFLLVELNGDCKDPAGFLQQIEVALEPICNPKPPMHYVSSDWHLDHFRALELNSRPFTTLEEQADAFFAEANALPDNATLYLLGDLVIRDSVNVLDAFLQRFKSTLTLVFIPGNHDHRLAKVYAKYGLCVPYLEISHQLQKLCLMHFPLTEWNRGQYGSIHLFGHCHGRYEHPGRALDVGWDVAQRIFSLDELITEALRKPIYQPCHSGNNGKLIAANDRKE